MAKKKPKNKSLWEHITGKLSQNDYVLDWGAILEKIIHLREIKEEQSNKNSKHKSEDLEAARGEIEANIDRELFLYVDSLIKQKKDVIYTTLAEIEKLKNNSHPSWKDIIEELKQMILDKAKKETKKSPTRRKIEANLWWSVLTILVVVFLSVHVLSLIDTTKDIQSKQGIINGARIVQKVITYDKTAWNKKSSYHQRGEGWARLGWKVIRWPIKPTDREMVYAGNFVNIILGVSDALIEHHLICGFPAREQLMADDNDDLIKIIKLVSDFILQNKEFDDTTEFKSLLPIIPPLLEMYPCETEG